MTPSAPRWTGPIAAQRRVHHEEVTAVHAEPTQIGDEVIDRPEIRFHSNTMLT